MISGNIEIASLLREKYGNVGPESAATLEKAVSSLEALHFVRLQDLYGVAMLPHPLVLKNLPYGVFNFLREKALEALFFPEGKMDFTQVIEIHLAQKQRKRILTYDTQGKQLEVRLGNYLEMKDSQHRMGGALSKYLEYYVKYEDMVGIVKEDRKELRKEKPSTTPEQRTENARKQSPSVQQKVEENFAAFFQWLDNPEEKNDPSGKDKVNKKKNIVWAFEWIKVKYYKGTEEANHISPDNLNQNLKVAYFDSEPARQHFEVAINNSTGVLTWVHDDNPEAKVKRANFPEEVPKAKNDKVVVTTKKLAAFVLLNNPSTKLYVGPKQRGALQHSSFNAGKPVAMAGYLVTNSDGVITCLLPFSGHYIPSPTDAASFKEWYLTHFTGTRPEIEICMKE